MTDYPFYGGLPPHEHVDTSLEAAVSMLPYADTQRATILAYIRSCGILGATQNEAELALGIDGNSIHPRFGELVAGNAIVKTPDRRKTTSGRWARVYVITALAPQPDPPPPGDLIQQPLFA